jgi:hypothetical protein
MVHYLNANHVEFHRLALETYRKHSAVIDAPAMIDNYQTALTQESNVFTAIRRSEFTKKKATVDRQRDKVYTGMLGMVRANLKNFDPQICDAAERVNNLLSSYNAVTKAGYDAETADIDSIVNRLRGNAYTSAVELLGLTSWVDELEALNMQFKTYADNTVQEAIDRPDISPKDARRQSDEAHRQIADRVEAMITLNGETALTALTAFIEEYNTLVKHYNTLLNEHYGRIHAQMDISSAIIAPVAPQPFTGKPVFVIPEVSLRSGSEQVVELVFNSDFTVGYKNNISPGTATLTIKGIGKYNGETVTTFNIVNP